MNLLQALESISRTTYDAPATEFARILKALTGAQRATIYTIDRQGAEHMGLRDDESRVQRLRPSAPDLTDFHVSNEPDGLVPFYDLLPGWWISMRLDASTPRGAIVLEGFREEPDEERIRQLRALGAVVALRLAFASDYRAALTRAETDPLTGLAVREVAVRHLGQLLSQGIAGSLLMMDLNGFKEVNDTLGHDAGDQLLIKVARAMRASIREDDTLARFGGDEFVLVTPGGGHPHRIIERITKALGVISVSAAIGSAALFADGTTPEALLRVADERMYAQKRRQKEATQAELVGRRH